MTELPSTPRGFRTISVWFPLVREVASFSTGLGLLIAEATHQDIRPYAMLIGLLLAGFPIAAALDRVFGVSKEP